MDVEVVVEIPKGTRNKYEADHETGQNLVGPDALHFHPVPRRLRLRARHAGRRR